VTETSLTATIRDHLATIRATWTATAEPMRAGRGRTSTNTLPSSTIVLRADITLTLAYWVHALVDQWPVVLQHLTHDTAGRMIVTTDTIDCTDVTAMADLLDREADRIAEHDEPAQRLADELEPLARAARHVSQPPRRDKVTIGTCRCGRDITTRAVPWIRTPNPTTDPTAYPPWSDWQPAWEQKITCPGCRSTRTLPEWLAEIVGPQRLLSAPELVELIHADLGMRYTPAAVRQWARRGMFATGGYRSDGRAVYDRVQVLASLVDRDRWRADA
jgi:hypothetical protein